MPKSLTTKTAKKTRKRAVESAQIRGLKSKTGLSAKVLRKMMLTGGQLRDQKLKALHKKARQAKKRK